MGITANDLRELRDIRRQLDTFTAQDYVQLLLHSDMAIDILTKYSGYSERTDNAIELLREAKDALQPTEEFWEEKSYSFTFGYEEMSSAQQVCTGAVGAALFGLGDTGFMDEA